MAVAVGQAGNLGDAVGGDCGMAPMMDERLPDESRFRRGLFLARRIPGAAQANTAPLALNAADRGFRLRSTHSEEASVNTSSVGFENLTDAPWLGRAAGASLRYENKKNI